MNGGETMFESDLVVIGAGGGSFSLLLRLSRERLFGAPQVMTDDVCAHCGYMVDPAFQLRCPECGLKRPSREEAESRQAREVERALSLCALILTCVVIIELQAWR